MRFLLNGNDWEAGYFISTREDNQLAQNSSIIENMNMTGALSANFVGLPGMKLMKTDLKATIPGCDRSVLMENGEIPDIMYGQNLERSSWAESKSWAFRKCFTLPENLRTAQRLRIRFEMLDYDCTVWLNGNRLGWHTSAFMAAEFDITKEIFRDKENIIAVVFEPIKPASPQHFHDKPAEFAYFHRSQMSYGWDWSRRLLATGIMDDVMILGSNSGYIIDAFFRGANDEAILELELAAEQDMTERVKLELTPLNFAGKSYTFEKTLELKHGATKHTLQLDCPGAHQWYPNNYGSPDLYTLKITFAGVEKVMQAGFRTIEMRRNPGSHPDAYALTYTINGKEVFVRGTNWVPADLLISEAKAEDYERLIRLAKEANFNYFRIWGGGIIEKNIFYDLCDRYGMLVHQEFMHACSEYPSDGKYLAELYREGAAVLKKIRSHVCISMICGGNELQYYGEDPASPMLMQYAKLAAELTPHLEYHVTSPDRSRPGERNHGPWYFRQHSFFNTHFRNFASEIGCNGALEEESVLKFVPEDADFPDNQICRFHFLQLDKYKGLQFQWTAFDPANRREYCQSSMLAQGDVLSYIMARYRRYMPESSGCVFWQYNEPWPTFSYSIVDYYHVPKIAHYYTARVNKPAIVSLEDDSWCITSGEYQGKAFVTTDYRGVFSGSIKAISASGRICYEKSFQGEYPEYTTLVDDIKFAVTTEDKIIFIRLELFDPKGRELFCDTRHYGVENFKELFRLEKAVVKVDNIAAAGNTAQITLANASKVVASGIRLRLPDMPVDDCYFMDNYLDLLPGEKRTVELKLANNIQLTGKLEISGWNIDFINFPVR